MQRESGRPLQSLKVDGGAAVNNQLLQFQADILGVAVRRPAVIETTALGAAYLAGLAVGYWDTTAELEANWALDREFIPTIDQGERDRLYEDWRRAVERSRGWARPRG
jgi:glycerol kinase